MVPLLEHLVEPLTLHLGELVDESSDAPLFTGPRGGDLRYSWWRRAVWAPACEAVGVDATIHALRHSAGKALSNAGVPTVVLKSFMGHASAAFSIDVYGHASDADLDEAAARLGAYRDRSLTAGTGLARLVPRDHRGIVVEAHSPKVL